MRAREGAAPHGRQDRTITMPKAPSPTRHVGPLTQTSKTPVSSTAEGVRRPSMAEHLRRQRVYALVVGANVHRAPIDCRRRRDRPPGFKSPHERPTVGLKTVERPIH
jgi:hypothetical protein